MNDLLNSLSIKKNNFGSCSGHDGWIEKTDTKIIEKRTSKKRKTASRLKTNEDNEFTSHKNGLNI